jgi:hypothetical protein
MVFRVDQHAAVLKIAPPAVVLRVARPQWLAEFEFIRGIPP